WSDLLLGVFGVGAVLFIVWVFLPHPDEATTTSVADLVTIPAGLIAAGLSLRAAQQRALGPRARRAWRMVAAAQLVYTLGDAIWSYDDLALGIAPFPSLADAAYLAFYPLMLVALVSVPM